MSMIDLKLFISINKQLQKAKKSSFYLTTVFDRLHLVVIMADFYQFALILGKAL